ncbi:hypothetical protein C8Q74DRAFT_1373439 [Fomes fomentarius]|nr:hypothetical protein C8Q74DRAFT_1373439 [Fomes fomentarius]
MEPHRSPPAEILWLILDAGVEHRDAQIISATDSMYEYQVPRLRRERLIALYDRSRVPSFARTMAECDDLALMVKYFTFGLAEFVSAKDNGHFDMPISPHVVAQLSNLQSLEIGGAKISSPMPPVALDFANCSPRPAPHLRSHPSPGSISTSLWNLLVLYGHSLTSRK